MIDETVYHDYFNSLLAGRRAGCMEIVGPLIQNDFAADTLYTDLFQRSLYQIGELWEQNRISVAVEHLATAVTESLLSAVYPRILSNRSPQGRRAVISCSVNEYHQVGARMVADILDSEGWDAWFVGANTPTRDLLLLIDEKKPDVVGLSVSIYFNMAPLLKMMEIIRSHYPNLEMLVGGQAFRWGGVEALRTFPKTTYIPSLRALIQTVQAEGRA